MRVILVVFFLCAICAIVFFICRKMVRKKPEWELILIIIQFLACLVFGFVAIYCFFFFRWGLPAGDSLDDKDWLAFLSGYLSFAGSLIMAWLVFKQSKHINEQNELLNDQSKILNELAMQEYNIHFKGVIKGFECIEYGKDSYDAWIHQYSNTSYFKYDIVAEGEEPVFSEKSKKYCLSFNLCNESKLTVNDLTIEKVTIKDARSNKEVQRNCIFRELDGSVLNGIHSILPKDWIPICFVFHSIKRLKQNTAYTVDVLFTYKLNDEKVTAEISWILYWGYGKITFVDGKAPFSCPE